MGLIWLQTSFKRTEEEWSSNPNLALEFELGLWSLEALYKLQNSLNASVGSLLDAKEKLGEQIKHVSSAVLVLKLFLQTINGDGD